jgi:4-hydroxyphenylpyruvate dioxygenase
MRPCISQATTLPGSFAEDVNAYADGGCQGMEVWLTKLEQHLAQHSATDTKKLLEDRQMTLAGASYQGGLLLSQGEQRRAHFDHFKRRLDLCQCFGIPTLLIAPDFVDKIDAACLQQAAQSLAEAAKWAAAFNVRLALEFRGTGSVCTCLETAVGLVAAAGEPNLGVNFDVFHYYTGPSKFDDLTLLTAENLAFVQVCDLAATPRELAGDADRIFPGEGDFRLGPILDRLREIGYDGWVSLEMLNPTVWKAKAAHVAELGLGAVQRLLEKSSGFARPTKV